MLITESYRAANAHLHESTPYGRTAPRFETRIRHMAKLYDPKSFLDYGSGKHRWVAQMFPAAPVQSYDPCIPELADLPGPADMLVCIDVLEHIEPELLGNVLHDIKRCMGRCGFVTIATRPAEKTLPDGRNAHLIVQSAEWWLPRVSGLFKVRAFHNPADQEIELWLEPR
jgi:hypothetical protein